MILHRKHRPFLVAQTFHGFVVEIDVRDLDVRRKCFGIHRESMILAGDCHFAAAQVFYRLIPAPMAELELEGFSAEGVAQQLMAETDGKNRLMRREKAHLLVNVTESCWIAGAIAE